MLLAQISDLHIKRPGLLAYKKVNTTEYLRTCIAKVNALLPRPDALIITGDLADFGAVQEYQSLRSELSALAIPYYLMVGNHDHRAALREVFPDHPYLKTDSDFIQYAIDFNDVSVLALDTQDLPSSGGRLCGDRLSWLAEQLAQRRDKAVMIAMHHPPFDCGIEHMDKQGLAAEDSQKLETLLRDYHNVERIICGHVHRSVFTRFANTIASICPCPAHQVAYDLRENGPSAFIMEPPAFHVHAHVHKRWVTHSVYVNDYGGRYPFYDENGKLID
ncbi:MAG: phosphodiesterase [Paralcaligenes sp.]